MKKVIFTLLLMSSYAAYSQLGIGLKGGLNFANVTNSSSINSSNQAGFMFGAFMAPASSGILSSRTELIYSRQGYNYSTASNTGKVNLDYLVIPQFMGINITKLVQLHLGVQMAFLLNAKADSTRISGGMSGSYGSVMKFYNKFDYGFGVGAEIYPVSGLLIGARYNVSLAKLYSGAMQGQMPSFSSADARNNVVQVFAGWIFGKKSSSKKNR